MLALVTPLLPVRQDTASIDWPQKGKGSIEAPLVSYAPLSFTASLPCEAIRKLPAKGGVLLSTVPSESAQVTKKGLQVKVADGTLSVLQRDIPLLTTPLTELTRCKQLRIESTATQTSARIVGPTEHNLAAPAPVARDIRPQLVGIFTDVPKTDLAGFTAHADLDSRFSSSPSWIKLVAIIGAVLATIVALVALHQLDGTDGRRTRRFLPAHWQRMTPADGVVFGVLVIWHFIGANTSDDGYILNMARVAPHAGYMANYYRWFGVPEAPFGWSYEVLALMAKVTDASPWVRLLALVPAILCWLVISREVLPRLGTMVRRNQPALWTAALVFLAFWLPYNNGLRPEPLIALGALLTWCSIERAIATGRLLPAAVAVLIAAFSLAAGPTGLISVAALLAGSRPVMQIVIARAREHGRRGYAALIAPCLAAGTLVLVVVLADQSLGAVLEATRVRKVVGPNVAWFDERTRWDALLTLSPDGSLARRFGVLAMLLCLLVSVLQVLRRGGRIPGTAKGPANRILGITFAALLLMMFTPTKWTHHFGVYAGLAGSLAALGAIAVSADGIRSRRNRALFAAAILFLLAMVFTGTNGWWYVSSYGIPWWDKPPTIAGKGFSTVLLGLTVLTLLLAAWHHYREPYVVRQRQSAAARSGAWAVAPRIPRAERRRIQPRFAPAPLTVAAAFVVLFEVASLAKGAIAQRNSYSIAESNFDSLAGDSCALANKVLVESKPNDSMLPLLPGQTGGFTAKTTGFTPDGVAPDLTADKETKSAGGANSIESAGDKSKTSSTTTAGTGAGKTMPFGLATDTPVLGSYTEGDKKQASFTSNWYRLERPKDAPLLVITAAGRIRSVDRSGVETYGQDVRVEYGTAPAKPKTAKPGETPGAVKVHGSVQPLDIGPSPSWRNLRVPLSDIPADANAVRIVAVSNDLTKRQWVAVTPPRVPTLHTLQSVVGSQRPVLLDWHVGLAFPCQRPFDHRDGVAEVPGYRIMPDRVGQDSSNAWQDSIGGGPLGWTELLLAAQTVPTYLQNDWHRDWGSLERLTPLDPKAVPATVDVSVETRSGLHRDSPLLIRP